jgi:ribosomal protein L11 methyltransferase
MTDLTITAGAHAFGDGSHPTTRLALAAMEAMDPTAFTPRRALDIGAGSGILSFAAMARFGCPVVAVDCEAQAVETLIANAQANGYVPGADGNILALQADGFAHPEIADGAPYDLIVMNILAEPIRRLAADAVSHLAADGALILSGILRWQEEEIRECYQALNVELSGRFALGDWVALVWQSPSPAL